MAKASPHFWEVRSIGKWTAQYVAMRALGEPDAFPSADVGLLRALGLRSSRELEQRSEAWRPWRAYAAMYLWNIPSEHRRVARYRNNGEAVRPPRFVAPAWERD
jgi:3-methyladenine DNA glycosylase/8-oxoguanine DNA glycosylase